MTPKTKERVKKTMVRVTNGHPARQDGTELPVTEERRRKRAHARSFLLLLDHPIIIYSNMIIE